VLTEEFSPAKTAELLLNYRPQMGACSATEEHVTLTKQTRIGLCEQVRVNWQTAALPSAPCELRRTDWLKFGVQTGVQLARFQIIDPKLNARTSTRMFLAHSLFRIMSAPLSQNMGQGKRCEQRDTLNMRFCRHLVCRGCALASRPSLPYLIEELVRWNEERVLLQNPADDHDRVRAQDIHCHACAKF
jgi:hypothetical protein